MRSKSETADDNPAGAAPSEHGLHHEGKDVDDDRAVTELAALLDAGAARGDGDLRRESARNRSGSAKKNNRLAMLTKVVERNGPLHLKKAASILEVSEMTVRRDIASCDGKLGYLGGYIVAGMRHSALPRYANRKDDDKHIADKETACLRASQLIEEDDILFIDCGTTLPYLAQAIPDDKRLTVVCYALNIADILCSKPKTRVVLLGGLFHPASATFASDEAMRTLNKLRITKAFFSAGGVHATQGVSCSHFHEVTVKQAVLNNAMKKYVVVDSGKFGRVKLAYFADITSFDAVITDENILPKEQAAIEAAGVEVLKG
ncbi:MAG: DeoR/GlpR family DNA-binding transcription regulator [Methylobacteriaceae bacterium]|jgi:DeoR family deoxyribose operon repressor|nr:DeoR/GlpR family DNA-binding transcription regulator [Methylobacteriaceae bacterium]